MTGRVNLIADVSWRKKIFAVSLIYALGLIVVGVVGGYTLRVQGNTMQAALTLSQAQVDASIKARVAIVEMGRAQSSLIAAQEPVDIRAAAIATIRGSSALDESIQKLSVTLAGNASVVELARLLAEIKPQKMEIIRAARGNDDVTALQKNKEMQGSLDRVELLSQKLMDDERASLARTVADLNQQARHTVILLGSIVGTGVIVILVIGWIAARLVTRPLAVLESSVQALARGDLSIRVPEAGKDEIGRTIHAMGDMVHDLNAMVANIQEGAGVLTTEAESVAGAADGIRGVSARLHNAVRQIKGDAETVLSATTTALAQLQQAAVAAQCTARSTADNKAEIVRTVDGFRRFQEHMERTATSSKELATTVDTITSITSTIRAISSQTNLLALNAAIEAARAGEQGRGFAVVADEVRELARRTESATAEISVLVESIGSNIAQTVGQLEQATTEARTNIAGLQQVADETANNSQQVQAMHDAMCGVVSVINDQERAVAGINGAVTGLFDMSQETQFQTELLNGLSHKLNAAATSLTGVVQRFKL